MPQWVSATDLANHLDLPSGGVHEDEMNEACIVAQAWITTRIRNKYAMGVIAPEIILATKYQAAKLFRRRQTPEGISQVGDFGPMRVMGTDPDVEALLRAYKYDGFSGGPLPTINPLAR
jgi:hypothetical protein